MTYFPQLVTGAVSQFPGSKRVLRRTIVNETAGGSTAKLADPMADAIEWSLDLEGLTDAEWNALEALFEAVEGRLGVFTFADPFDNLLRWSEDLTAGAWAKGAGLAVTTGIADPLGDTGAGRVTNQGGTAESIQQTVNGPGWYQYCLSVYARSAAPATITLFQSAGAASASRAFAVGETWKRLEYGAKLSTMEETAEFGVTVEPGATVELFGFQVDAQMGASRYRKTTARGGVHEEAWFLDDTLTRTAAGPDDNSSQVRIRAGG